MGEDQGQAATAQHGVAGATPATPPPSRPSLEPPTPVSALIRARKELDDDTTKTWLLVALCAVSGFYFSFALLSIVSNVVYGSILGLGSTPNTQVGIIATLGVLGTVLLGVGLAFILPVLVVLGANRAYKRQYDWITAEMVHGDMALMLVDESYGRMIQEWRQARFQLKGLFGGEVHVGDTFALRLHHFAAYAPQYFRMAMGQREFPVTQASPLNCWTDGVALGCLSCTTNGCLAWLSVFLPLRIVYTYPRSIATRRAALDYFGGKWELALEQKYSHKPGFSAAGPQTAAAASAPAGSLPPP